ncbi:ferric iron reductase protein FhuF|uniref:Ferric iron reductase protein FhuF n=1 Tax=Brenneria salicis ATCC 15712 = DSM 30166 TaxID=714314 RepID=A0A366I5I1_9GAMM|nr:siderophore-iron reductase FhuF [Brenneria salicis]NMN92766.1 ferric iron reductase protein FhuF [Brenneria salicis ATCC 15712 = DSM 30166]RBP63743.1 ferric iron reductase protein FhuF [Brenneria salicis ATCC 15712 = DSM 30166]RLM31028.1 hydroxamate siderophore iron reductase FhuF [Brenneria salicis ATCC 15712 = DSM 30166]
MPIAKNITRLAQPALFPAGDRQLADALNAILRQYRPDCLDTIKLGETPPPDAVTLAEWSRPVAFRQLLQRYGDELYRAYPDQAREEKPLQSLWAQWYIGLLVPPLMLVLLKHTAALDCSWARIYVEFHHTGRPAAFYIAAQVAADIGPSPRQRLEMMLRQHLIPVVTALDGFGALNGKLVWNNTGYLMHWFLGELAACLPQDVLTDVQNHLFFSPSLLDGGDNPLYRTVIPRGGIIQRRSCCQRYCIPGVEKCLNCTLNTAG